jgi:hypothetical protein
MSAMTPPPPDEFIQFDQMSPKEWAVMDQNVAGVRDWVARRMEDLEHHVSPDCQFCCIGPFALRAITTLEIDELRMAVLYLLRTRYDDGQSS